MQFHVYLPRLLMAADRLEQSARRQQRALTELTGTLNRLNRLSYMENQLRRLRRRARQLEDRLQETLRMAQTLRRIHEVYSRMEREAADGLEFPVNHLGGIAPGRTLPGGPGGTPVMPPFGVNGPDIIIVPKGVSAEEAISGLDIAMVLIQLRGVDILGVAAPVELLTVEVPAGLTFGAYAAEG